MELSWRSKLFVLDVDYPEDYEDLQARISSTKKIGTGTLFLEHFVLQAWK